LFFYNLYFYFREIEGREEGYRSLSKEHPSYWRKSLRGDSNAFVEPKNGCGGIRE